MKVVWVSGATCSGCGHPLTAREFTADESYRALHEWPVPCTEELVRKPLTHWEGCGGRLLLENPEHGELNVALASQPRPPDGVLHHD